MFKKKDNIDDIIKELGFDRDVNVTHKVERISDELIKRDSYFHSCWNMLKFRNPELYKEMAEVELLIAGYDTEPKEDEKEDPDDSEKGIVL